MPALDISSDVDDHGRRRGIIYLPDGMGLVALSVMSKEFTADTTDVETLIARIARFVYDYYFTTDK